MRENTHQRGLEGDYHDEPRFLEFQSGKSGEQPTANRSSEAKINAQRARDRE